LSNIRAINSPRSTKKDQQTPQLSIFVTHSSKL
jgi:hypothetical protein